MTCECKPAGWIAFYNRKKLEIPMDATHQTKWDAVQHARAVFKVPKSKTGLMACEVAYPDPCPCK